MAAYAAKNQGVLDYHNDKFNNRKEIPKIPSDIKKLIAECCVVNYKKRIPVRELEEKLEYLYKNLK
jgi:hypothetical protein